MADYTVVPGNVLASASASKASGTAGVNITAGQTLAMDNSGLMVLYDANGASPINVMKGIALHGALVNQPIAFVTQDNLFAPGFSMVAVGDCVIGSQTPGGLCPDADKASGWYVTEVGRAIDLTHIKMRIIAVGAVR